MKKYFAVFCAILLIGSIAFSVTGCDLFSTEETTEETTLPDKQEIENNPEALVAYYDQLLAKALSENPGGSVERTLDVKDIQVTKQGSEEKDDSLSPLKTALEQAKNYILAEVKDVEIDPDSTLFGDNLSTLLYDISMGDVSEIDKAYYEEITETDPDTEEETKTTNNTKIIFELTETDYPAPEGSKLNSLFKAIDIEKAVKEFEKLENYLVLGDIDDFTINYEGTVKASEDEPEIEAKQGSTIVVQIDRKADKVTSIVLTKILKVVVPAKAMGSLEEHGDIDISFKLTDTTRFNFDWFDPEAEITTENN